MYLCITVAVNHVVLVSQAGQPVCAIGKGAFAEQKRAALEKG